MQWEEIKEGYIKHVKSNLGQQKTYRGIHRVLKRTNFIKHYMKLYRERTTKDFLWTLTLYSSKL